MLKTKRIITILIACILTVVGPISVYADELYVPTVQQQMSNWCWAASAQMLGQYEEPGSTRTQYDVVVYTYGSPVNQAGSTVQIAAGAQYVCYNLASFLYGATLSESQINYVINTLHNPLQAGVIWYDDLGNVLGGHSIVVSGYDGSRLKVIDPWTGSSQWMAYSAFLTWMGGSTKTTSYTTNN